MKQTHSLKRQFFSYIVPSVAAQWIYALYTMVDGMFVAQGVSETALAAVNLSFPFIALLFSISLLFAAGASTIIGILLGRKQAQRACEVFSQNIVTQFFIAALIMAIVLPNLRTFGRILGAQDEQTLRYVVEYLTWIVPFSMAFLLSYSFEILLKTDGFPKKATCIVLVGVVENCILDYLLVIVLHKGVAGAAFATSISQASVIMLYLLHFLSGKGVLHFRKFRFRFSVFSRVIRNGVASGITEFSTGAVTYVFNHAISAFIGAYALVSYTIVSYVSNLVVLSATGVAQGAQPLISIHYGKKDTGSCEKLLRYSVRTSVVMCLCAFALCFAAAEPIVGLYTDDNVLRQYSVQVFRIYILPFFLLGFNISISGYFTAIEKPVPALLISIGRSFVLLVASLALLLVLLGGSGIWWAPALSEVVCFVLTAILFWRYEKGMSQNIRLCQ